MDWHGPSSQLAVEEHHDKRRRRREFLDRVTEGDPRNQGKPTPDQQQNKASNNADMQPRYRQQMSQAAVPHRPLKLFRNRRAIPCNQGCRDGSDITGQNSANPLCHVTTEPREPDLITTAGIIPDHFDGGDRLTDSANPLKIQKSLIVKPVRCGRPWDRPQQRPDLDALSGCHRDHAIAAHAQSDGRRHSADQGRLDAQLIQHQPSPIAGLVIHHQSTRDLNSAATPLQYRAHHDLRTNAGRCKPECGEQQQDHHQPDNDPTARQKRRQQKERRRAQGQPERWLERQLKIAGDP